MQSEGQRHWGYVVACVIAGMVAIACGLLVPAYLRAVDVRVVQQAGKSTPGIVDRGLALVADKQLGAAQMLLQVAQQHNLADSQKLATAVSTLAAQRPDLLLSGCVQTKLEPLFRAGSKRPGFPSEPFTDFIIRADNRERALELLRSSPRLNVQVLVRSRVLTNTVIFSPSASSSGQAFDAALSICGLLLDEGYLTDQLSNALFALASEANRDGSSQRFEQALLDFMSLGRRLNWGQLVTLVGQIEDTETLRLLANQVRENETQLPVLFSAIQLSGKPEQVVRYAMSYSQTGLKDLATSLRYGSGGLTCLLERHQRIYHPSQGVAENSILKEVFDLSSYYSWRTPWLALAFKWLLYVSGGFLLAASLHFARYISALEQPLQVRGFHFAREILFALGFLLVVLLLSEPFLAHESQKVEFPFRLQLPTVGSIIPAGKSSAQSSIMNQLSLLTLLLFFVLQGLIYTACLVKLAEIRRQKIAARLKLKLLENEDHLFDAGLYLGFVGTIISLILVSLGVIKPSLMAAYSSTSFGIIFVSVFKIFHLRPVRRSLLLEVESNTAPQSASQSA